MLNSNDDKTQRNVNSNYKIDDYNVEKVIPQ